MDIGAITGIVAYLIYGVLIGVALWGAFCVSMVWLRVSQKRFRNESDQTTFLEALNEPLAKGNFEAAADLIAGDQRAVSQLAILAIENRNAGFKQVQQMIVDRFQRDILSDLEHRLSWVTTVIKVAPMAGLLGTVIGMMGAFAKLAAPGESVNPAVLAEDISVALITTASGLAIAIPLVFCMASINVRIRKMEDLVAVGLAQFLDIFKKSINEPGKKAGSRKSEGSAERG